MYKVQLNSFSASASSSAKLHIQKLAGQHIDNDLPMIFQDRAVVPHTIKNV
jgi:hypothetical protein